MTRIIDRWIPDQHKQIGSHNKARLLIAVLAVVQLFSLAALPFEAMLTNQIPVCSLLTGLLIAPPTALALWRSRSLVTPAHMLGASMTLAYLFLCVVQGGLNAPALPALILPPMLVLVIAGRGPGALWGSVVLTALVALAIAGDLPVLLPLTVPALDQALPVATVLGCLVLSLAFQDADRDEVEAALHEESRRAEHASAARSRFLATMSHEIRTPMNGVLGMADLLAETDLDAEQAERVAVLREAGASLMQILDDILDLSKLEAGSVSIERIPVDAAELIRQAARLFEGRARERGLALSVEAPDDLWLHGDPTRLRQVLSNLVSNAIKFTESGEVSIVVAARTGRWSISVHDTGIGMSDSEVDRLFQPFEQADATTTRRYGGTGLGLAIVQRLVKAMDGKIRVGSTPGQGSVFEVTLPLLPAEEPAPLEPIGQSVAARQRSGLHLLVVEDNPINRKLVSAMLQKMGVERVDMAEDGVEALSCFRASAYHLILMDMQMPRMDGLEATAAIRRMERDEQRRPTPIVALTASALAEDRRAAAEAGTDAFLTKPLRRDALGAVLDELIADAATVSSASRKRRAAT